MVAVREIQASHVHAFLNELANHILRTGRWTERADDLGSPEFCLWLHRTASPSASATRPSIVFIPRSQNRGSAKSTPNGRSSSRGLSLPPDSRNARYLGTKSGPSRR